MSPEAIKFQPRMVASFNLAQLDSVKAWFNPEVIQAAQEGKFEAAFAVLEQAQLDEKGKPIDEKGRRRLQLGLDAVVINDRISGVGKSIRGVIAAWQEGPNDDAIRLRYIQGQPWEEIHGPAPSVEFIQAKNKPVEVVENLPIRRKVEIGGLLKQAEDTRLQAEQVRELVHDKFGGSVSPFLGLVMGSDKKSVTNPDGSIEEVDWTLGNMMDEWHRQGEVAEVETRRELAQEVVHALREQHKFFITREEPTQYHQSEQVIECTLAVLEWVARSKDNITEPFPIPSMITETRSAAEMVEVIRRIVLRPTYMLMEGVAESEIRVVPSYDEGLDFWEDRDERMAVIEAQMKDPKDLDERLELQRKVALENPTKYSFDEWQEILGREMQGLTEYLQGSAIRSARDMHRTAEFYLSLTENGEFLVSDEVKKKWEGRIRNIVSLGEELGRLEGFDQVLPWIKQKFGQDATFKTLFLELDVFPSEKGQENPIQ